MRAREMKGQRTGRSSGWQSFPAIRPIFLDKDTLRNNATSPGAARQKTLVRSLPHCYDLRVNYIDRYRETHQHPVNKGLHLVGIPSIVLALPALLIDWRVALGLWIGGWIIQFVGHAFEGKAPAFFSNPIYLIVGPYWWAKKLFTSASGSSDTPRNSPAAAK